MSKLLFKLILLFYPSIFTVAQFDPVRNFSVKDGLPSGVVYDCLQDKQGFMWFATAAGLARFDGTNFKVFTKEDGLTNNEVLQLGLDKDGSIWIFLFETTPCIYDPATQILYNEENYPELQKFKPMATLALLKYTAAGLICHAINRAFYLENKKAYTIDVSPIAVPGFHHSHDLWLMNRDSLILFYNNKLSYLVTRHDTAKLDLTVPAIAQKLSSSPDWGRWKIFVNSNETTELSLFEYENNRSIKQRSFFRSPYIINTVTRYGQQLYIATASGIYITDTLLSPIEYFFPGKNISKAYVDKDGNEWLCSLSGEGVYMRLKNDVKQFNTKSGLPMDNITSIRLDNNNLLICGDSDGNIYSIDPTEPANRPVFWAKLPQSIRGIELYKNSFLGYSSYTVFANNEFILERSVSAVKTVVPDHNDNLVLGTHESLMLYNRKTKRFDSLSRGLRFTTVAEFDNKLYFANNRGFFEFVKTGSFTLEKRIKNSPAVLSQPINHMVPVIKDSLLWIATNTAGILAFKHGKVIAQFNTASQQPLTSNICKKIFLDKETNSIWVVTNKGLNKISYTLSGDSLKAIVNSVTSSEGLNDDDVNDVCVKDGKVYAATIKGICIFKADLSKEKIPVRITDISIIGYASPDSTKTIQSNYNLTNRQNNISISYAGICFTCDQKLIYQYRMFGAGDDTTWKTTTSNTVEFRELKKGSYIFQVRTDPDNMQELNLYIKPAFWQTNSFYVLIAATVIILFFLSIKFIARQIRKREIEKTVINKKFAELEFQALQAQMNPHFVFNAMNTLQNYILKNESENASEYLAKFARLMRLFLESSRNKLIELKDEVELLQNYIELEQVRLQNTFQYRINIDPDIELDTKIPSVMIQPFVENAILHGLRHKTGGDGLLELDFNAYDHTLICRIKDNGIGRKESAKINKAKDKLYKSQAINIIDEKVKTLKAINNVDIKISITDNIDDGATGTGTTVTIQFGLNS